MNDFRDTYKTGIKALDDLTGGFQNGHLILLGGRPAMGKSSFAYSIVLDTLEDSTRNCALFSLELPANLLIKRLAEMSVEQAAVNGSTLSLPQAFMDISLSPLFLDSDSSDIDEIVRRFRCIRQLNTLIVVDYLQLVSAGDIDDEYKKNTEILRRLKQLADESGRPVLVLSQLSRAVEQRRVHRPKIKDLSGVPAEALDYVDEIMLLYRSEYYNPDTEFPGVAVIEVAKHAEGKTGVISTGFNGRRGFYELEDGE